MTQVLGYTAVELVGKSPFDLMPEEEEARHREIFARLVIEKQGLVDVENWNLSKEGHHVCLLSNAVAILDEDGNLTGFRGADRDITERRQMEDELLDSRNRLRNLTARLEEVREEERTALARELHDEVGQALTAMRMDLAMAEKEIPVGHEQLADRLHSMLDLAQDSVDRVNRMSHDLRSPVLDILGLEAAVESEVLEYQERWERNWCSKSSTMGSGSRTSS